MPNPKIRIKSAKGSLAWRALFVSICLLVLPLFLHTIFLFHADYKHNEEDVSSVLHLTADAQKSLLNLRVRLDWKILDATQRASEADLTSLQIQKIPTPSGVDTYFVTVDPTKNALIVGKQIDASLSLALATPLEDVLEGLTQFEQDVFPTSLALTDETGRILAGTKQKTPFITSYSVEGANFLFYLSIPANAVKELNINDYIFHFLSLFFFIGGIGGLIVWFVTRRIARPLMTLCQAMEKVSEGAFHARYTPDRMGFEINALGNQFNETLDRILYLQQEAERERIIRERLAQELKIGHEIQISLLPTQLPSLKGVDLGEGFLPALEVGGDFYDLFPMRNGAFLIAIADTSGKGISACLYSLGLRSMLRALASTKDDLADIVMQANDLFWHDARGSSMFVTLWVGIYHPENRMLEYCSQGHPPALLVNQGTITELWTPGIALGTQVFDAITTQRTELPVGSLLFLYTDGIIEAHNPNNQLFGTTRLHQFLTQGALKSSTEIVENLLKEVHLFSEQTPQHDDIALVVFKILKE